MLFTSNESGTRGAMATLDDSFSPVARVCGDGAMEVISGHESLFAAQQSWCALNPRCQFQGRSFISFGVRTTVVDCAHVAERIRRHSVSRPQ